MRLKTWVIVIAFLVCAQPANAETPAPERQKRIPVYTENGAQDCLRCHSGEQMRVIQASPHGNADHPLSPAAGHGCESCHGPGSIHISRAHGGRGFPPLTRFGRGSGTSPREEQLQACLGCHSRKGAFAQVIGFIGSAHDRQTINCSSCHTVHAQADPMAERDQQFATCNRCHRRHLQTHPRFEEKSIDFDALKCSSCHDVHAAAAARERLAKR